MKPCNVSIVENDLYYFEKPVPVRLTAESFKSKASHEYVQNEVETIVPVLIVFVQH